MIGGVESETPSLISRMLAGDEEAAAALYRDTAPIARRAAQRIVHDSHLADDLVQEAFYLVLRAIRAGRGPTDSFGGYLVTTVKRLAYRQHAAQERVIPTNDDMLWESDARPIGTTASPDDLISVAWSTLPDRWRLILWLIEVDRYSPAEIAPSLALTPNAVSSLATRARRALRASYLSHRHT